MHRWMEKYYQKCNFLLICYVFEWMLICYIIMTQSENIQSRLILNINIFKSYNFALLVIIILLIT